MNLVNLPKMRLFKQKMQTNKINKLITTKKYIIKYYVT